jgi:uncharacterized protein YjbI with pentapeptide repeats
MIWLRRLYRRIEEIALPVIDSPSVRRVAGLLLLSAVFAGLLLSIQRVPEWQTKRASVRSSAVNPEAKTTPEDVAAIQNEMRKTLLQEVGGAFALFALYLTFRRVKVAEQGHITDRYTKAIEQLGALTADNKPNVEVRLGAIYALERIAFDSPRDHWPIMEVLTAYVRQNAPAPAQDSTKQENDAQDTTAESEESEIADAKKPATEIQAILTVLGRRKRDRKREGKGQRLNLSNSDLCGADLTGAHLDGAIFDQAHLDRACFNHAHLEGAWFGRAHLQRARFIGADLTRAIFPRAHLDEADLSEAHLDGANFSVAHLDGANYKEAHLDGANFNGAHLDGALFPGAHMYGASFSEAHLDGAWYFQAYLGGAKFLGAHLVRASFYGAYLAGATFDGAVLDGANFCKAVDLTVGQFANTMGVGQAYFDAAFRRELEAAQEAATKSAVGNDTTPQDTHPTEK